MWFFCAMRLIVRSINSARVQQLVTENQQLKAEVRDYDRVKKAYGSERIAATVQVVIAQEQAQRNEKRTASRDVQ